MQLKDSSGKTTADNANLLKADLTKTAQLMLIYNHV